MTGNSSIQNDREIVVKEMHKYSLFLIPGNSNRHRLYDRYFAVRRSNSLWSGNCHHIRVGRQAGGRVETFWSQLDNSTR